MDGEASLRPRCTGLVCILLSSPRLPVTMVVNTICCLFNKILYRIYLPHLDASVQYRPPLCRTAHIHTAHSYRTFTQYLLTHILPFPHINIALKRIFFNVSCFQTKPIQFYVSPSNNLVASIRTKHNILCRKGLALAVSRLRLVFGLLSLLLRRVYTVGEKPEKSRGKLCKLLPPQKCKVWSTSFQQLGDKFFFFRNLTQQLCQPFSKPVKYKERKIFGNFSRQKFEKSGSKPCNLSSFPQSIILELTNNKAIPESFEKYIIFLPRVHV